VYNDERLRRQLMLDCGRAVDGWDRGRMLPVACFGGRVRALDSVLRTRQAVRPPGVWLARRTRTITWTTQRQDTNATISKRDVVASIVC